MPAITEPRELFLNDLKAMLYVERKLADEVLPELGGEVTNGELKESIERHRAETERHVANLERVFELLGERPKADKSHAVDGLVAQHEKVAKHIESDNLLDLFDATSAAKTEHLEIASYEGVITAAEALGEDEIVSLLEENLDQEREALEKAKKAVEQLAKEGTNDLED